MAKNKKEIKYPKPSNSKENVNNIKTYHVNATNINDKLNKKKSKSRKNKDKGKQSKPNKSKINLIIKKINKISINKTEERKTKKILYTLIFFLILKYHIHYNYHFSIVQNNNHLVHL